MEIRKLRRMGGSGSAGINLPKKFLQDDGVVGPDGVDDAYAEIEHVENGRYEVHLIGVSE